jgi:glycosyltransferase involved in cell wall biosynthesis
VRFPGYIPYPELPALYAAADLFVHPAREERWGVSVQEALACGLPVVASSRVGAAFDLIQPGGNGFVYEAGDEEGLIQRIADALILPPERVRSASAPILALWDYAASWRSLLESASRAAKEP